MKKPTQYSDFGTPELHKRKEIIKDGWASEHRKVARVKHASMLEYYRNAGHISDKQYDAGYLLSRDWVRANKNPKVTNNYEQVGGGQGSIIDTINATMQAEIQYNEAIYAVSIAYRSVLVHVCCLDGKVTDYKKSAMPELKEGLDQLIRYHGL